MSNVFIIVNEWTAIDGSTSSEVVGATWFDSEDSAWGALNIIAEPYGGLEPEETNLVLEDHVPHLQFEEYYIQELMNGDSK